METEKLIRAFGGNIHKLIHESKAVGTRMRLNVYVPPKRERAPVMFYLSGLTCTADNALEKGGFIEHAAKKNIALVFPDTSPRTKPAEAVPGEHGDWDLGSGAGFYINATEGPWKKHYRMESYVMEELMDILPKQFPQLDFDTKSICGHSMGGHGALTLFLKYPKTFKTVSAFSPIAHPTQVPWGQKAFKNYFGSVEGGAKHDATELIKSTKDLPKADALIDVGLADQFYSQLRVDDIAEAASGTPFRVELDKHEGYDHSYFFVSTFSEKHINHHAKYLCKL